MSVYIGVRSATSTQFPTSLLQQNFTETSSVIDQNKIPVLSPNNFGFNYYNSIITKPINGIMSLLSK